MLFLYAVLLPFAVKRDQVLDARVRRVRAYVKSIKASPSAMSAVTDVSHTTMASSQNAQRCPGAHGCVDAHTAVDQTETGNASGSRPGLNQVAEFNRGRSQNLLPASEINTGTTVHSANQPTRVPNRRCSIAVMIEEDDWSSESGSSNSMADADLMGDEFGTCVQDMVYGHSEVELPTLNPDHHHAQQQHVAAEDDLVSCVSAGSLHGRETLDGSSRVLHKPSTGRSSGLMEQTAGNGRITTGVSNSRVFDSRTELYSAPPRLTRALSIMTGECVDVEAGRGSNSHSASAVKPTPSRPASSLKGPVKVAPAQSTCIVSPSALSIGGFSARSRVSSAWAHTDAAETGLDSRHTLRNSSSSAHSRNNMPPSSSAATITSGTAMSLSRSRNYLANSSRCTRLQKKLKRGFLDEHLWLATWFRRPHDTFRSTERLTCLLASILGAMAVNAMFFGSEQQLLADVLVSMVSSLLIIPADRFFRMLFKRSGDKTTLAREAAGVKPVTQCDSSAMNLTDVRESVTSGAQTSSATASSRHEVRSKDRAVASSAWSDVGHALSDDKGTSRERPISADKRVRFGTAAVHRVSLTVASEVELQPHSRTVISRPGSAPIQSGGINRQQLVVTVDEPALILPGAARRASLLACVTAAARDVNADHVHARDGVGSRYLQPSLAAQPQLGSLSPLTAAGMQLPVLQPVKIKDLSPRSSISSSPKQVDGSPSCPLDSSKGSTVFTFQTLRKNTSSHDATEDDNGRSLLVLREPHTPSCSDSVAFDHLDGHDEHEQLLRHPDIQVSGRSNPSSGDRYAERKSDTPTHQRCSSHMSSTSCNQPEGDSLLNSSNHLALLSSSSKISHSGGPKYTSGDFEICKSYSSNQQGVLSHSASRNPAVAKKPACCSAMSRARSWWSNVRFPPCTRRLAWALVISWSFVAVMLSLAYGVKFDQTRYDRVSDYVQALSAYQEPQNGGVHGSRFVWPDIPVRETRAGETEAGDERAAPASGEILFLVSTAGWTVSQQWLGSSFASSFQDAVINTPFSIVFGALADTFLQSSAVHRCLEPCWAFFN